VPIRQPQTPPSHRLCHPWVHSAGTPSLAGTPAKQPLPPEATVLLVPGAGVSILGERWPDGILAEQSPSRGRDTERKRLSPLLPHSLPSPKKTRLASSSLAVLWL